MFQVLIHHILVKMKRGVTFKTPGPSVRQSAKSTDA